MLYAVTVSLAPSSIEKQKKLVLQLQASESDILFSEWGKGVLLNDDDEELWNGDSSLESFITKALHETSQTTTVTPPQRLQKLRERGWLKSCG